MAEMTPMMQQYLKTKEAYPDCILFYRLGDFYEMFFEDALTASKELELTLTGKDCGLDERAPMCGVPHHAADVYINKLVGKGYKVAIGEQMEDPKLAKGLVKREVVRVVTPGTNLSMQALDEAKNNFLMCLIYMDDRFGIAVADISTGDFNVTEVDSVRKLTDEVQRFGPSEIICNDYFEISGVDPDRFKSEWGIMVSALEPWYTDEDACSQRLKTHFHVADLAGLGLSEMSNGIIAAGALLQYLFETQKNALTQMTHITPYRAERFMVVDNTTRRNLELLETLREKQKRGSLLWVLDKTKTAMGARMLRTWIEQPYIDKGPIEARLDAVEEIGSDLINREEIREYLNAVYDLERLASKISARTANPRDLSAFKSSLSMLPHIRRLMDGYRSSILSETAAAMDPLTDLYELVDRAIVEDPPAAIKDGGIIRDGYHPDIDRYRHAKSEGKQWLAQVETREREATGIKNLRVRYNKVFGYYLEVTNSYKDLVPDTWMRKQTLTNAERYITPELKDLEETILGAEDKLFALEYDLFSDVRDKIAAEVSRIQNTAKAVARMDVLASLSTAATQGHYVRPKINSRGIIDIRGGRHPVVEKMIPNQMFIDNDAYLDQKDQRIAIITGPNMAGKSTYMRQCALIVLMAQMGSFVPARSANIGIVDRIFTRVGASDDLASGQSTFMVEMTEVANILRNATSKSLLILDEIGRGTSTFDGLSIAWAVVEHINDPKLIGAKTLFATHYHELTELEGKLPHVHNYCIAVKEQGDDIIFLRKIVKGGADKSYGIQVARLAGVPDSVIARAKELVKALVDTDITDQVRRIGVPGASSESAPSGTAVKKREKPSGEDDQIQGQMTLFDTPDIQPSIEAKPQETIPPELEPKMALLRELAALNLADMRPMDAMIALDTLQQKLAALDV